MSTGEDNNDGKGGVIGHSYNMKILLNSHTLGFYPQT